MGSQLKDFSAPEGFDLLTFDQIDSTNAEAQRQISKGVTNPLWIVASSQSKGRGRRGNAWVSDPGNLYCTLVLPIEKDLVKSAELSFVTANIIHKTLGFFGVFAKRAKVKWPNDVLVDGKKISGILMEVINNKSSDKKIIIGLGINVIHSPHTSDYKTTNLKDSLESEVKLSNVFNALSKIFNVEYQEWLANGFKEQREYWVANAMGMGKKITVRLPGKDLEGIFSGLKEDGALLLESIDGTITPVYAGDLFFI